MIRTRAIERPTLFGSLLAASGEIYRPGTAWMKLDAALHRVLGVGAATVTTLVATRKGGR